MNVFVLRREGEPSAIQFHLHELQASHKLPRLAAGQNACPFEGFAVRDAALDVVGIQAPVIGDRRSELFD